MVLSEYINLSLGDVESELENLMDEVCIQVIDGNFELD
jgi:hypothetical protein